jgi:putative membrane protein
MTAFLDIAPVLAGSNWDHGGFWWAPFGLLWLVLLGTVVWLVLRSTARRGRTGVDRARDILAERYARGELSRDEYRERLDELR